jgi:hypothetical protein
MDSFGGSQPNIGPLQARAAPAEVSVTMEPMPTSAAPARDDKTSYLESLSELLGAGEATPRGLERAVKVEGEEILWTCAGCGTDNGIRVNDCAGCGMSFVSTARRIADEETTERAQAGERFAADTLRRMAAATRAGPLAIPLLIATAIVGILKGVLRALHRRG